MAKPWTNADGLQVPFGNYWSDPKNFINKAKALTEDGAIRQVVIEYDLTKIANGTISYTADLNNDGTADGFSDADFRLPANASVIRATVVSSVTAAGGTSFALGTFKKDGTAIDADGIVTDTEAVTANLTAGKRVYGAGAYVATTAGTAGVGAANAYLGITATGTFTAGKGVIIVEYVVPIVEAVAD